MVTLFGVALVVGAIRTGNALRQVQQPTLGIKPPAHAVVCRTEMTPACAREAAKRVHLTVAWIPVPAGYRLQWLGAAGDPKGPRKHRIAFESMTTGSVDMELDTQPGGPWQPANERLIGTYLEAGTVVTAYHELILSEPDPTTLTLRWRHRHTQYQLWVSSTTLFDRLQPDPARSAALVAGVRYANPPRTHA